VTFNLIAETQFCFLFLSWAGIVVTQAGGKGSKIRWSAYQQHMRYIVILFGHTENATQFQ